MVNVIVSKTKHDCEHLLGTFLDESHYDTLIEEDTDCYLPRTLADSKDNEFDEQRIAFKFRKNFFSKKEQEQAYIGLREAATESQNRGLAAGPKGEKCGNRDWVTEFQFQVLKELSAINSIEMYDVRDSIELIRRRTENLNSQRGLVWLASEVGKHNFSFDVWLKKIIKFTDVQKINEEAKSVMNTFISDTTYANAVNSGIAGWFDRYPRIPYGRATAYTEHHYEKFEKSFPFLQTLNKGFKKLLPKRWAAQKAAIDKIDSRFLVPETVFTTITVNKTFRTAAHRDAGDFSAGLSNLLVLSNDGNFTGGYLIFPEYRTAVNVRPGDLLLVNNHEIIHGNTEIVPGSPESERISLVCYLREKMLELGSYEYENLRYQFVEERRKNEEHKLWNKRWNGISPGMWEDQEWYDYIIDKGNRQMLIDNHPKAIENSTKFDLTSLFE